MMKRTIQALFLALALLQGCAAPSHLEKVKSSNLGVSIGLVEEPLQKLRMGNDDLQESSHRPDTMIVHDNQGNEMIIMKAIKDENGEMVATDVINAAVVEARFRNVAERHGKVNIEFQIRVPKDIHDDAWQLRFYPQMHILGDTLALEHVIITGPLYRKAQLKGYQQYEKYLASIITDSTRFVNLKMLEVFIQRNIPELYAFKADSAYVADEHFNAILDSELAGGFATEFGVTGRDAIEHYTNTISKRLNARRMSRREEMYRKYVRVPITDEGLRLDTVITATNGDFVYNYVQTINSQPKLRKVEVVLTGDIYEQDKRLYEIPATEPLTYYISSLSAFVDGSTRYKKKIISRRVEANTACYIDFEKGSTEIIEDLSHNRSEMGRIKENLASLIENREFDLDSIVVTASCSPEGTVKHNTMLSQGRSEAVSHYFSNFIEEYKDSLQREAERIVYFGGFSDEEIIEQQKGTSEIRFISRNNPENWRMLDALVATDTLLTEYDKKAYNDACKIADLDLREERLQKMPRYIYFREKLYPRLRTVKFDFHLHRKGMVQDTVQTTVVDEDYMIGVQAIRDRDYETAITLLKPYRDFNAAVALCAMDYNASALEILESLPESDQVDYMLAIIYSRQGKITKAQEFYSRACELNPSFVHRGNLDPEIQILCTAQNDKDLNDQTHKTGYKPNTNY